MDEPRPNASGDLCTLDEEFAEEYRAEIPAIVDKIVAGCRAEQQKAHLVSAMIPSKESVIEVLADLKCLLFPGYFCPQEVDPVSLPYQIGNLVNRIFEKLAFQISRSIRHECRRLNSLCTLCLERGQKEAMVFLKKIPALRVILAGDVQAAYDGDPAAKSLDEIIFSYPGLAAIATFRLAHELHVQGVPLLPRIMTEQAHSVTGIDIHPGARIGEYFFIDHGTGVVIGETTEIGHGVRIYQGVTLGALSFPKDSEGKIIRGRKRHPTIQDDVTIYSNATILGPVVIGARSVIGGNTWITRDVPADTVVAIETPRLQYKGNRDFFDPSHP